MHPRHPSSSAIVPQVSVAIGRGVHKALGAPGGPSDPSMIAFKVDQLGRAVPKDPDQIANPYVDGKFLGQRIVYDQHVLNSGHQRAK